MKHITIKIIHCVKIAIITISIVMLPTVAAVHSGELLPLPPDRGQIDPRVYSDFRQHINDLNCAGLRQIRERLIQICSSSKNERDIIYYHKLISIADEVIVSRRCP